MQTSNSGCADPLKVQGGKKKYFKRKSAFCTKILIQKKCILEFTNSKRSRNILSRNANPTNHILLFTRRRRSNFYLRNMI